MRGGFFFALAALLLVFLKLGDVHLETIDLLLQMIESPYQQVEGVGRQFGRSDPRRARICARKQSS